MKICVRFLILIFNASILNPDTLMSRPIHLAIASTTSKPGLIDFNLQQIIGFARRAAADGAQLLLTPEMSASGYGNHPDILQRLKQPVMARYTTS